MNRVRFAPSPTGFLHIGGARTYIFNWLFARSTGGRVALRIDDTDAERSSEASLRSIVEGLEWLELPWDEQHYQSRRKGIHREAAEALQAKGAAYRDFTPEDAAPKASSAGARTAWLCNPGMRELSQQESDRRAAAGEPFVLRFRVPRERADGVSFKDAVFGKQFRKFADIEDFALLRANGGPTYHLASTVDDCDLGVTHVIRGQDHLSNTYKHVLIFEALGRELPQFGHLPLLLGPDGSKLSKRRHGPIVSVTAYRDKGFLPCAFVNYLSLLGWSPKDNREVLSVDELVSLFQMDGVLRANAVVQFDEASEQTSERNWADPKALWLNGQHLRSAPVERLLPRVEAEIKRSGWWQPDYDGARRGWLTAVVDALRSRFTLTTDFSLRGKAYFDDDFDLEAKAAANLDKAGAREGLRELARRLETVDDFSEEEIEAALRSLAEERGVKPGLLINGARAALTGQSVGPSAFKVFTLIGRDRVLERLAGL